MRSGVFIAMLFAILTGLSCKKSSKNENAVQAVITGFDMRMCVCCGGLMINFEGITKPVYTPDYYYQIINDPASLGITTSTTFPVFADVTWEMASTPGCGSKGFVKITSIVIH